MNKQKLKKEIEKEFLKLRGWKDWEEYDRVGQRSEGEINTRDEIIDISIKQTIAEALKVVEERIERIRKSYDIFRNIHQKGNIVIDGILKELGDLEQKLSVLGGVE